jgi:hypothetical protein
MKENAALTVEDLRIQFMPYGSLLWNTIKPEYVQSGSSSLIIHMSGWSTLTGVGFQELLKHDNETVTIQKYAQEEEMKWQRCSKFYEKLDPATIASMQVLMGVYAYATDSLHIGVQEIFKELDNGQNMTVTEVSKKLYTMAQVEEAKDHLQKANGGQKEMIELDLDVNSVQADETRVCNNPDCRVTFTPSKSWFYSCNTCHKKKQKQLAKKSNKGDENEKDTDNDGEDENSDSCEDGNSETSESEQEKEKPKMRNRKKATCKSETSAKTLVVSSVLPAVDGSLPSSST